MRYCSWLFLIAVLTILPLSAKAQQKLPDGSKRMVVILKTAAVENFSIRPTDRKENLFPDQRIATNPRAWASVSLKAAALIRDLESRVNHTSDIAFGNVVHGFGAALNQVQIDALKADPRVKAVFDDILVRPASVDPYQSWTNRPTVTPPSSSYTYGWNLYAIGAINNIVGNSYANNPSYRGFGPGQYPVKAYIIDSGIQPHADLNFAYWVDAVNFDCHVNVGGNCAWIGPNWYGATSACDSHATHVAGIVGAHHQTGGAQVGTEGVAPGAQLVSVKVLNYCNDVGNDTPTYTGLGFTSGVLAAIDWVSHTAGGSYVEGAPAKRLTGVANMSIVWDRSSVAAYYPWDDVVGEFQAAISRAVKNGIFFTMAAGNSVALGSCDTLPGAFGKDISGAMSVGAIAQGQMPMSVPGKLATYGSCVEIWAPGQEIHSTGAGPNQRWAGGPLNPIVDGAWGFISGTNHFYFSESGSSMAAPHVAGAALLTAKAYMLANGGVLPYPSEIEARIKQKARQITNSSSPWNSIYSGTTRCMLTVDRLAEVTGESPCSP